MPSADEIIIYDTEYWSQEGAMARHWGGLDDQPPLLIQIGALKVKLEEGLPLVNEFMRYVIPRGRDGGVVPLTPYFEDLTGIKQDDIDRHGLELSAALHDFSCFTGQRLMYSYSYDLLSTVVPSCYIAGIDCPFSVKQERDVRQILRRAGMSDNDINANTSGSLAGHFGIDLENHWVHDARCDALSILATLRHLQKEGALDLEWLSAESRSLPSSLLSIG